MTTLTTQQGAELRNLFVSLGRAPSPSEVRELARSPGSSLHELFTWDRDDAAEERQIEQARDILAAYVFIVQPQPEGADEEVKARFFVATPTIAKANRRLGHDSSYTDHTTAERDHSLYDSVISAAIGAIKGNITRFGSFPPIAEPLRECLSKLEDLRRPRTGARASAPTDRPDRPALTARQ